MHQQKSPCIFCELIHGGGEVSMCYEDSQALAFMDIQPVNVGHVLVVPRAHYESLVDMPGDLTRHLFDVAIRLAPIVRRLASAEGLNVIVNSGAAAGQDVFHYHVHVIPRRADDGFSVSLPFPGSTPPERTQLDAMAALIISELRDPCRATGEAA
jgi:histidine triad (HIT) family protein